MDRASRRVKQIPRKISGEKADEAKKTMNLSIAQIQYPNGFWIQDNLLDQNPFNFREVLTR